MRPNSPKLASLAQENCTLDRFPKDISFIEYIVPKPFNRYAGFPLDMNYIANCTTETNLTILVVKKWLM